MKGLAACELNQDPGEMRTLLLAAGKRRQLPLAEAAQSNLLQRRIDKSLGRRATAIAGAHVDDLLDRKREGDIDVLRQHCAMQGELARRIGVKFSQLEPDLAAGGAEVAGQQPQQRRFAGAVRSDNGDRLAAVDTQVDRIDQRCAVDRHRDRSCLDHGRHSPASPRCRSSMARKNGAPTAAVRMPIGISAGATMVRASVSAPTSSTAPSKAEAGSNSRCAGPITSRSRCGTTMPTNPTTPQTETATPVMADTNTIEIRFNRSTSTPP